MLEQSMEVLGGEEFEVVAAGVIAAMIAVTTDLITNQIIKMDTVAQTLPLSEIDCQHQELILPGLVCHSPSGVIITRGALNLMQS